MEIDELKKVYEQEKEKLTQLRREKNEVHAFTQPIIDECYRKQSEATANEIQQKSKLYDAHREWRDAVFFEGDLENN